MFMTIERQSLERLLTERTREQLRVLAIMGKCLGSRHPNTKTCKENLEIAELEAKIAADYN
jgi:hypothetical protein